SARAPYLAGRSGASGAVAPRRARCPQSLPKLIRSGRPANPNRGRTATAIYPTPQQIDTLLAGPADQPVVMVNLLRFKQRADGGVWGEEACRRYAEAMRAFVESKGGRFLWVGRVDSQVIGTGGEGFHMIGLVEYPSRAAFVAIATDPHVQEIGVHRAAGLESQWLIAATAE